MPRKLEYQPDLIKQCFHLGHNPPMHLFIPAGERWEHTCPACGKKTVAYNVRVIKDTTLARNFEE